MGRGGGRQPGRQCRRRRDQAAIHPSRPRGARTASSAWLRWIDHAARTGWRISTGCRRWPCARWSRRREFRPAAKSPATPPASLHLDFGREQVPAGPAPRDRRRGADRAGIEFRCRRSPGRLSGLVLRPGDPLAFSAWTCRVPAADCLHLFKLLAAGQLRGITWFAPVLLRLHELDQFEDAALVKAKVAALFTGFITDPDGTAGG